MFDYIFTYWGAIAIILIGILIIQYTMKNPAKPENQWFGGDLQGYSGATALILIGVAIIIAKIVGKL